MATAETDGFVNVLGYRLYFRSFTPSASKGTILCLHGGPGSNHEYLLPLADLTAFGYRVVFMDQLGCGNSELPIGTSTFTIAHNVEEVEGVRKALDLGKVHLMGSSYGGLLALSYALKYQANLRSLVTTGGLSNVPLTVAEMKRLLAELPAPIREVLTKFEAIGDFENPDYVKAVNEFYHRHLCRLPVWPKEVKSAFERMSKPVYYFMNGPNEFTITGTIKDENITSRLGSIQVPCLVTTAKYDEVTPVVAQEIHDAIPGSRLIRFEESSHTPMWEEREAYIRVLANFLDCVH